MQDYRVFRLEMSPEVLDGKDTLHELYGDAKL